MAEVRDLQHRFTAMESRLTAMESRLAALESRFSVMEQRFAVQEERMTAMLGLIVRLPSVWTDRAGSHPVSAAGTA